MRRTPAQRKRDNTKILKKTAVQRFRGELLGQKLRIGIVTARFNSEITEKLEEGALARLIELGVSESQIQIISVPGAVEIITAAAALFRSGVDAVIMLGCVIRGETTHYEMVCQTVEHGGTLLQLETKKPVVFGVLTTENVEQALARVGGTHGHKGAEAAEVAIEMCNLLKEVKAQKSRPKS